MKWHLDVPKILHVYWGTGILSYLRYLTVDSFLRHNPDWKVMLWQPRYPAKVITWDTKELDYETRWTDYTDKLIELCSSHVFIDFDTFGIDNSMSEVHKSDYIRCWALHTYGGVWSDMDILYLAQLPKLLVNIPENKKAETFVCISPTYGHSIGFLMAKKGSAFFKKLMSLIVIDKTKYQSAGSLTWNEHFPTIEAINEISPAINIGMEAVYAHDATRIRLIYTPKTPVKFSEGSVGLHWFAGHALAGKFLQDTNGGIMNYPNNIIGNLIKKLS